MNRKKCFEQPVAFPVRHYCVQRFLSLAPSIALICALNWIGSINLAAQEPAFSARIFVVDDETGKPIPEFSVVPASHSSGVRHHTWQGQYQATLKPTSNRYTMKRGWNETVLRVEAPGYLVQITEPLPRERNQKLSIRLVPDSGIRGVVLMPNGLPAKGSAVALCTWSRDVTVENGEIRYNRNQELFKTGTNGVFHLPSEPDEWVLVVAHDSGYAERTKAEMAESSHVLLQQWGCLNGQAIVDGKPLSNMTIDVGSGRGDVDANLFYAGRALTDASGRFEFAKLPPVQLYVCPVFKVGDSEHKPISLSGLTEIRSGGVTEIKVPRPGQVIRGRVVLPYDSEAALSDFNFEVRCMLRPPSISGFRDQVRSDFAAYGEFMASDFGKHFQRDAIPVKTDGEFEINGLPEANYTLQVYARAVDDSSQSRPLLFSAKRITVAPHTPENPTADIGEIVLQKK